MEHAKTETVRTLDFLATLRKRKGRSIGYAHPVDETTPIADTIDGFFVNQCEAHDRQAVRQKRNARGGFLLYLSGPFWELPFAFQFTERIRAIFSGVLDAKHDGLCLTESCTELSRTEKHFNNGFP